MKSSWISALDGKAGADVHCIHCAEAELGRKLPQDYRDFVQQIDGAEVSIGAQVYIAFWPVNELAKRNKEYEVARYAPGLIVFASNGGGEAFGFDTRKLIWNVVMIPFIGMDWQDAVPEGQTFTTFLDKLQTVGPFPNSNI